MGPTIQNLIGPIWLPFFLISHHFSRERVYEDLNVFWIKSRQSIRCFSLFCDWFLLVVRKWRMRSGQQIQRGILKRRLTGLLRSTSLSSLLSSPSPSPNSSSSSPPGPYISPSFQFIPNDVVWFPWYRFLLRISKLVCLFVCLFFCLDFGFWNLEYSNYVFFSCGIRMRVFSLSSGCQNPMQPYTNLGFMTFGICVRICLLLVWMQTMKKLVTWKHKGEALTRFHLTIFFYYLKKKLLSCLYLYCVIS